MEKKKILFIYPSMLLGGSTTSLLAFLNSLDPQKYQIDLQLQGNGGPLFDSIPSNVNVLPEAKKYKGKMAKFIRFSRMFFQGAFFKSFFVGMKNKKGRCSNDVINEFWAKHLSKPNDNHYDYAISFLEGWGSNYLAYRINADKKYAWIHSTFSKTTDDPKGQLKWIDKVNKVVFVTDACKREFEELLPEAKEKGVTVENIIDSEILRKRAEQEDATDEAFENFKKSNCTKIITVCRVVIDVKGLDRVVAAAAALRDSGVEFLWYVVGDGADLPALTSMIENAGLKDMLVPIGRRGNPYPFIKAADIMCMPSRYEGKPMVITESQILGTVPIVTEYLSANDQIKSGVDGVVVPNGDDSIIAPLLELASDKDAIMAIRQNLLSRDYGNREYIHVIEKELFEGIL